MSSVQEIIHHYAEKKVSGEMDLSAIKADIQEIHSFSDEELKALMTAIQDKEFEFLSNQQHPLSRIFQSNWVSLFFFLFALLAFIFSIYILWTSAGQSEKNTPLQTYLPWVILLGALFLMLKHGLNLRKK